MGGDGNLDSSTKSGRLVTSELVAANSVGKAGEWGFSRVESSQKTD